MRIIYSWNEQRIDSYLDASHYTNFHHHLASYILPYLKKTDTIFDFGCGLGQLDIEIAPYVKQIKGFDACDSAIETFRKNIEEKSIGNIEAVCQKTETVKERCDVGIMSFYGMGWAEIERHFNLCSKSLITIFNWENESTLYPSDYRRTRKLTAVSLANLLNEHGIKFQQQIIELEFGQPFQTYSEAIAFVSDFAPTVTKKECDVFLETNLKKSNDSHFSFYLPNKKKIGLFCLEHF